MCWRQVSKRQKTVILVFLYLTLYFVISYILYPEVQMTFVDEQLRIGDKYVYIFLVGAGAPIFSDAEGAGVFPESCGKCFMTNNKGFLPTSEYDAVLTHGGPNRLDEALMDPDKHYLLETTKRCLSSKFNKCRMPPKITSFGSKEVYGLCDLCASLHKKRLQRYNT